MKMLLCSLSSSQVKVLQLCLTLCDPMDCNLPGSSVQGICQVGILEWVAISLSGGSSWSRDQTQVSCITGRFFTNWATREARHGLQKSSAVLYFIFSLCWMFLLLLVWCSSTCFLLLLPLLWCQIQSITVRPISRTFSPRFSSQSSMLSSRSCMLIFKLLI